jgi:hypothetical protein
MFQHRRLPRLPRGRWALAVVALLVGAVQARHYVRGSGPNGVPDDWITCGHYVQILGSTDSPNPNRSSP